jgi:hypothetical protein
MRAAIGTYQTIIVNSLGQSFSQKKKTNIVTVVLYSDKTGRMGHFRNGTKISVS